MAIIIAGRFEQSTQSDHAIDELFARDFARDDVSVFYVTPAGQHDATPVGGDDATSPGAELAHKTAGTGAALGVGAGVVGAAVGAVAGLAVPMVAVAALGAAAAGAYSGSLAGAMSGTMDPGANAIRHAGMLVAVRTSDDAGADAAIEALRDVGALDIERAEGTWEDGQWTDFDPTRPPHLIDPPLSQAAVPPIA